MAWTYSYPASEQGSGNPVNFYKWRTVRGLVQMRLTDVAISGGAQWYSARYHINLITASGQVLCDTDIHKDWGVPAPFKSLCFVSPATSVRMQVTAYVYTSIPVYNWWSSELRWDNSQA
ncbi:hypothetical protein ACTJKH_07295 [Microbacterium sp. 22215]|uniref:hypothetical protein n=1 Tax=Microbacterium sp. 22215 TaxID=3453893 RepID=UPI003F85FF2F